MPRKDSISPLSQSHILLCFSWPGYRTTMVFMALRSFPIPSWSRSGCNCHHITFSFWQRCHWLLQAASKLLPLLSGSEHVHSCSAALGQTRKQSTKENHAFCVPSTFSRYFSLPMYCGSFLVTKSFFEKH